MGDNHFWHCSPDSTIDVLGTLTLHAYIGALDGTGDLSVKGLLNFTSGSIKSLLLYLLLDLVDIQGTGQLSIEPSGSLLLTNDGIRESYLLRNTSISGNATFSGGILTFTLMVN